MQITPPPPPGLAESRADGVQGRGDAQNKRQPRHALRISCPRPVRAAGGAAPPTVGKMLERSPTFGGPESQHEAANSSNRKILVHLLCAEGLKRLEPLSGGDVGPSESSWLPARKILLCTRLDTGLSLFSSRGQHTVASNCRLWRLINEHLTKLTLGGPAGGALTPYCSSSITPNRERCLASPTGRCSSALLLQREEGGSFP